MRRPGLINDARREVARCQRAVDKGGDRLWWGRRLHAYALTHEAAAAILRMEIFRLAPPATPDPKEAA